MLRRLLFALILVISAEAKADGPLDDFSDFCVNNFPAVQAIAQLTYPQLLPTIQYTPTGPVPGLVIGLTQRSSVIERLCNVAINFSRLDTMDSIFASKEILNEMTDRKFQSHIDQLDQTWNLANNIYDFENGTSRRGAFESVSTYNQMNDYINNSYSYYHRTFNGQEARLKNRSEREREMNEFARVVQKRAILEEALNCPTPKDKQDFSKIYEREVQPQQDKKNEAKEDFKFFKGQILKMATKFLNNINEMNEFAKELEDLELGGVGYSVQTANETVESAYNSDVIDRTTKKPKVKMRKIKRKIQTFVPNLQVIVFTEFEEKYSPKWRSWVSARVISTGFRGLLIGKKERMKREFSDIMYRCNPIRLMRNYDVSRPDYYRVKQERIKNCQNSQEFNEQEIGNLFNYYMTQMQTSLYNLKSANAKIWSADSKYLGRHRSVSVDDINFQEEIQKCEEANQLSPAQMTYLQNKQKDNLIRYKDIIARNLVKKTNLMEQLAKEENRNQEEERRRKEFAEKTQDRLKNDISNTIAPAILEGGY